jgi:drug/metabolite transporter (DMT)-like permease
MFRGREKLLGVILVLINSVGIAGKSVLIPLLLREGLTSDEIVIGRVLYALPVFWLFFLIIAPKKDRRLPERREFVTIALLCLLSAIPLICHTEAYAMMSASLTSVLVYMFPIFVVGLEWIIFRKRPHRVLLFSLPLVYSGILIMMATGDKPFTVEDWSGVAYTVVAAFTFGLYLTLQSRAYAPAGPLRLAPVTYTAWASLIMPVITVGLLAGSMESAEFLYRPNIIGLMAVLAITTTAIPFISLLMAIQYLGASLASLISAITPALTVLATALVLDEILSTNQYLGVGLVILGLLSLRLPGLLKSIRPARAIGNEA